MSVALSPSPRSLGVAPTAAASPRAWLTWRTPAVVGSGLFWGTVVSVALTLVVLFGLGGWEYYATSVTVRGYEPTHKALRPSGPFGQMFGVIGTLMLLVPFVYAARKRVNWLKQIGSHKVWLEVHYFCGLVGPVLVTLHTTFKFNGIVSAAYWSMVVVVISGFVGRYLYVRIPRSIRGIELTRTEMDARLVQLKAEIASAEISDRPAALLQKYEREVVPSSHEALSIVDLLFGEITVGRRLRALDRALAHAGLPMDLRASVVAVTGERAMLLRRLGCLQRTTRLFKLWHVFHLPLVYLLLIIAAGHIALALYMGYVPFRW